MRAVVELLTIQGVLVRDRLRSGCLHDDAADGFGDWRRNGVAESFYAVHPMGNSISSSTNSGCGVPPIWSGSVGVLSPFERSRHDFADIPFQSLAVGVR